MKSLEVLPVDYKYLFVEEKFTTNSHFECKLRLRGVNTEELARKWLTELSARSMVTWKIARTYPKSGKINVYKAEFRCQHKVSGKQKCMKRSKNTNCPALLRICIRRFIKASTSKDLDPLTKLWPCIIDLKNIHNHSIYSADSLQYRPIHSTTKEKLSKLFECGHSPSTAVEMLKIEIMLTSPAEYVAKSVDTSFVPLSSFCYREYTRVFGHNYRLRDKNRSLGDLQTLLGTYINGPQGGRAAMVVQHEHLMIPICTPIMQRVHKLVPESKDLVFLRVYGHVDKKARLFILTTQTSVGELPLGCIVTDTDSQDVFKTGLYELQKIFPPDSFYGAGFPTTIIVDEDSRRKVPLEQLFPSSLIIGNQFNILRQAWDWLCDERNSIEKNHREILYRKFKSMVYAKDEQDLHVKYMACLGSVTAEVNYEQFGQYVGNIWPEHTEWSSAFRDNIIAGISTSKTSNYYPAIVSRILDENIIQPTQTFNLLQLTHFVITHFEKYWEKRLTDNTSGKYVESQLKIFLPSKGVIQIQKIRKLERALYSVPSESGTAPAKTVDMDLGLCTCSVGSTGKICKHQTAVIDKYNIGQSVFSLMPGSAERKLFYEVGGCAEPEQEFSWVAFDSCLTPIPQEPSNLEEKLPRPPKKRPNEPEKMLEIKRRMLDIRAPDNYAEVTDAELEEGKGVASEIGSWLTCMLKTNPLKFIPALKTMYRNINELRTEDTAAAAMHQFGKDSPTTTFALIPSSPNNNEAGNMNSQEPTTEISFITHHSSGLEDELELVPVTDTYVPVQTLEGEEGISPRYLILVSEDGKMELTSHAIPLSLASTTEPLQMNGQLLFSQSQISEEAVRDATEQQQNNFYKYSPEQQEQEILDVAAGVEIKAQP